jgi:hypothetical protein
VRALRSKDAKDGGRVPVTFTETQAGSFEHRRARTETAAYRFPDPGGGTDRQIVIVSVRVCRLVPRGGRSEPTASNSGT